MGHHKIRILSLPFAFFIGFIIYSQLFGDAYITAFEQLNYGISGIGLLLILINYFVVKQSKVFLIGTAFLASVCLALSAFAFLEILVGAAGGNKNIYILFMIPFALFLLYTYYELIE